jgi:hypothetical protein
MKHVSAVVAGLVVGMLLSGLAAAILVPNLPPRLRGPELVWTSTAIVVALAVWTFWSFARARRQ